VREQGLQFTQHERLRLGAAEISGELIYSGEPTHACINIKRRTRTLDESRGANVPASDHFTYTILEWHGPVARRHPGKHKEKPTELVESGAVDSHPTIDGVLRGGDDI
jgi:hypothetical protein